MFSQVTGTINSNNTDVDYYTLRVTEKTDIDITLSMLEKDITSSLRLELYNDQLEMMGQANYAYELEFYGTSKIQTFLEKGTYFIKIYADANPAIVDNPYSITIDNSNSPPFTEGSTKVKLLPISSIRLSDQAITDYVIKNDSTLKQNYEWFQKWVKVNNSDITKYNDPQMKYQYHLAQVNAINAWKETTGEQNIIVAIIDQGIDIKNFDLKAATMDTVNMLGDSDSVPMDHGTHTSGIIVGQQNNRVGISGIAPGVTLMPINAWDETGSDRTEESTAKAIRYAVDHGARIISMSILSNGFAEDNNGDSQIIREAVKYAFDNNVVLIAAAGNSEEEIPNYPANYPEVIAVGAVDGDDELWEYSSKKSDIVAPGYEVFSTGIDGRNLSISGTSMATPIVAGAAALILSKNPELTNTEVYELLYASAVDLGDKGVDTTFGNGRLDIAKALQLTPEPKVKVDRFKGVSGKWYKDVVSSFYENRFINDEILSSHPFDQPITKKQFIDLATKAGIIMDEAAMTKDKLLRGEAFEMLFEGYTALYGERDVVENNALKTLVHLKIVNGRTSKDGKVSYDLEKQLSYAEAMQLLYNFEQSKRANR
ncbi:S8 family peptidase [Solibacillus cecembensis]|uniref:S8 family peptidase n=1 Tax=Solibacillus cecembensis TaxID=459347 RepID=UPI003CFEFB2B